MPQDSKNGNSAKVIHFPATIDAFQMVRMKSILMRRLNQHPRALFLDLGQTREVKLAGLGILVDRLKRFRNGTREIRFTNVSPQVHRTLVRAGVNELFTS